MMNHDSFAVARALMQPRYYRDETPARLPFSEESAKDRGALMRGLVVRPVPVVVFVAPKEGVNNLSLFHFE